MTLTEFLTARLDEDEAGLPRLFNWPDLQARSRREVEAKRAIVAGVVKVLGDDDRLTVTSVVGLLAAIYSDHPDYRDEWRTTQESAPDPTP